MEKQYPVPGIYPFWFWNGDQTEDEIDRQMQLFAEGGCKGVLLHSRTGNRTPYLSDRWLALVRHTCEEAKKLNMRIWIYDEDGYPSGNAGQQVQLNKPELYQKYLLFSYGKTNPDKPSFAAFDPADGYKKIDEKKAPADTPALLFNIETRQWHVDTFHPESVKRFIQLTHERYAAALSEYFGNVIEAIYTDDESFQCCCIERLPWSEYLIDEYKQAYGRNLLNDLPYLVEDLPGSGDIRVNYYRNASRTFLKNFIKPQQDWCTAHGLTYTGHLCCDEGPMYATVKAFYEPMEYLKTEDIPSIDDFLGDMKDLRYLARPFNAGITWLSIGNANRAPLLLYKTSSSIAHQFAKNNFTSEVLTFISWAGNPEFMNGQILFELGMGVTHLIPHAFYYTLGRGTRNDCPPTYFYQQPFYHQAAAMYRNWTKAAERLQKGQYLADTLVIYPARTASLENGNTILPSFSMEHKDSGASIHDLDDQLADLNLKLHQMHVEYDLGSEWIMKDCAKAEDGKIVLGDKKYSTVILPPAVGILPSTQTLLTEFQKQGGCVHNADDLNGLVPSLKITGSHTEEILVSARLNQDGIREYYLVNLSGRELTPNIRIDGAFTLTDGETMEEFFSGDALPENFVFPAMTAFFLTEKTSTVSADKFACSRFARFTPGVPPELTSIQPLQPNTLVLTKDNRDYGVVMAKGAKASMLYVEDPAERKIFINGKDLPCKDTISHRADPCFRGVEIPENMLNYNGENKFRCEPESDLIHVEGSFSLREHLLAEEERDTLTLGDLAEQGYPHYHGSVVYAFRFNGKRSRVRVTLKNGMAEVEVNSQLCGTVPGKPGIVDVSKAAKDGANVMTVTFAGTMENFITGSASPFGIFNVEMD